MPFKTRDFLLFITTVAFLLIAITATATRDYSSDSEGLVYNFSLDSGNDQATFEAVVPETPTDKREENLANLRSKIAKLGDEQSISSKVVVAEETEDSHSSTTEELAEGEVEDGLVQNEVRYCDNYTEISPVWSPDNLEFEMVEGARVLYRGLGSNSIAGGDDVSLESGREFILQLPLRTRPVAVSSCIQSDVIGIALDGSLIRNNEHQLYGIFGKDTLIGYALDGFPIYGTNDGVKTDACGGVVSLGEYRYYLSSDREGVLGCYSGAPIKF